MAAERLSTQTRECCHASGRGFAGLRRRQKTQTRTPMGSRSADAEVLCAPSLDFPKAGADSRAPLRAWEALRCARPGVSSFKRLRFYAC